jgi:site-specific recombinase XerD
VFVQHFLGHANLSTTERYMHAKARREDVERLNRAFGVLPESADESSA